MPRRLGTLVGALFLALAGCDSSPSPGRPPDTGHDAGPDGGPRADAGPTDGGNGDGGTGDGGTGALIGPSGGTVRGWYGAEVTIPAGALTAPVFIAIDRDGTGAPPVDGAAIFSAGAPYALTPHGTAFAIPATVRIPFDPNLVPTDGVPQLYRAEPDGGFAPIPSVVDGGFMVADVSSFSWFFPGYGASRPRMVYAFVSGTNAPEVTSFRIDHATGGLGVATSSAPVGQNPVAVSVHPSRRFAYVVNGGFQAESGIDTNSISVYPLDPVTGAISGPIQTQKASTDSPAGEPVAAVIHPTGKFLYVVNHDRFGSADDTDLSVFTIDSTDGTLSAPIRTADSGGAPPTAVALSTGGHFAYVTYMFRTSTPVGNTFFETVKTYAVNPVNGTLSGPIGSSPTGTAPWAIQVDPNDQLVFVASLSGDAVQTYAILQNSGVLSPRGGITVQSKPTSLAVDSEGRFLYVGKQQPFSNRNLEVYSVDGSGGLSLAAGLLTGSGSMVGPMALVAEPQGQFVYAVDQNANLVPFVLDPTTGGLTAGTPVPGVLVGGSFGGVGDPSSFAASGTSPIWVDGCTVVAGPGFVFEACPLPSSSGGTVANNEGGGDGGTHPPASSFALTAGADPIWGGIVVSEPPGISIDECGGGANTLSARFPRGTVVTLRATPCNVPTQTYDFSWTGGCAGTGTTVSVGMNSDVSCRLNLTPTSTH
jgi:6-phosphogluconolactonase (cycloisomerase 2 family)